MSKINFKKLEKEIDQNPEAFLRAMGYQGNVLGGEFVSGDIYGYPGKSFSINLKKRLFNDLNSSSKSSSGKGWINLISKKLSVDHSAAANNIINTMGWDLSEFQVEKTASDKQTNGPIMPVPTGAPEIPYKLNDPLIHGSEVLLKAIYEYRDEVNRLLRLILRFEGPPNEDGKSKKEIRPLFYFGPDIGWKMKGPKSSTPTTLFGLEMLAQRPLDPVLLVEGEKTALAARDLFPDHVCVTWLGGVGRLSKADWAPLSGRHVVYWRDADDTGQKTVAPIQRALGLINAASLRVIQGIETLPNKWDLADPCPDGIDLPKILADARPMDLLSIKQVLELSFSELPDDWVYLVESDDFYHLKTGMAVSRQGFDASYRHIPEGARGSVANRFLEEFRDSKLMKRTYIPGNNHQVVVEQGSLRCLNLWRPCDIKPVDGDATPFIDQLRSVAGNDEDFEHLANALAFMIQAPGEKLKFAPIIVGRPGTGKSYIGKVMRQLVGLHNSSEIETHMLQGDFNTYMEDVQLVVLEELMAFGRRDILNRLKAKITEPFIQINRKYANVREIRNTANFIAFTNHADALPIDAHDRRYLVARSDEPAREPPYYKFLWGWTAENPGVPLHWLLNRDLRHFDANAAPPMTQAKLDMMASGRPVLEAEIARMIEEREPPFDLDLVEVKRVVLILREYMREANPTSVGTALKSLGAKNLGQKKVKYQGRDEKPSLWVVRNVDYWETMPSAAIARAYFERQTGPSDEHGEVDLFDKG